MVKTSARPYKHMVQTYVYKHIQQTACHAGQQQQPDLAHGGRTPETDGAKSC